MAASDPHPRSHPLPSGQIVCLSAEALTERLDEEINRAGRHGTPLSCLLVVIDNLGELSREHGGDLPSRRSPTSAERCGASCAGSTGSAGPATASCCWCCPAPTAPRRDRGQTRARQTAHDQGRSRGDAPAIARLGGACGLAEGRQAQRTCWRRRGPPRGASRPRTLRRSSRPPRRLISARRPRSGDRAFIISRCALRVRVVAAAADGRSRPGAARRRARC